MVRCNELAPRAQEPVGDAPFRLAEFENGELFCQAFRLADRYLLRFMDIADFEISADGRDVLLAPAPGADKGTIDHLYLNHVVPHALSQTGALVFHASAVVLEGRAVAFVGEAGMGKSTLAAAFASRGYAFLCDDGLHVTSHRGGYSAHPSHPSLRLWQDSENELGLQHAQRANPVSFTPKSRLVANASLVHAAQPSPLVACFCLRDDEGTPEARIDPLAPAQAFKQLFAQSFLLDTGNRRRVTAHFDNVSDFAARIPCFTLDYPRRYDRLGDTGDNILAFVNSIGRTP